MIMCFVPSLVPHVVAGFEALKDTPEWYREAVMIMILASVGIRYTGKIGGGIANAVIKMKALSK